MLSTQSTLLSDIHTVRSAKCTRGFKSKSLQSAVKTFENAVSFCRHILFYFSIFFFFRLFFFFFLFLIFLFSKWLPDNEAISSTSHSPVRKGRVTTIMNHKSERIPALFFASQATTHAATYQKNNWQ